MSKRILILSEWGSSGEGLLGPLETFDQADFATPTGKRRVPLSVSTEPDYTDPALARSVTSAEVAEEVRALDQSDRLGNPINHSELMPDHPYHGSPNFLPKQEACLMGLDKDGTAVMGADFVLGPSPDSLEYILRDATAAGGSTPATTEKETSAIVGYPFISGRSTPHSYLTGQMVEVLETGRHRWGCHPEGE